MINWLRSHVELQHRWYDLYIGAYIDWPKRTVYLVPFPTIVVRVRLK